MLWFFVIALMHDVTFVIFCQAGYPYIKPVGLHGS